MAASSLCLLCCFVLFFSVPGLASSSSLSPFVASDGVFAYGAIGNRALLQAKTSCPVDFEHKNYTIITSKCKGPQFAANSCCTAFKEFACPYASELNDLTNDCATVMFSYIRTYGNYPPGLFANECRDTKQGLDCTGFQPPPPSSSSKDTSGNNQEHGKAPRSVLLGVQGFLVLLLHWY